VALRKGFTVPDNGVKGFEIGVEEGGENGLIKLELPVVPVRLCPNGLFGVGLNGLTTGRVCDVRKDICCCCLCSSCC